MIDKRKVYQDTALSSKAVSVYLYLCERASKETKSCYPSMKTIAKDLHLSLASVKRSIQELERSAYIKKENRFRDNGGKSSNLYFIEWIWKRTKKSPPQKTMKNAKGGGLSSAWAMVWLNVSRECELFNRTANIVTEKKKYLIFRSQRYCLWLYYQYKNNFVVKTMVFLFSKIILKLGLNNTEFLVGWVSVNIEDLTGWIAFNKFWNDNIHDWGICWHL